MKEFKCLAQLAGYIVKPNIANCIDKSILWGCLTFQLEIYDLPKCPISSIQCQLELSLTQLSPSLSFLKAFHYRKGAHEFMEN